MKPKSFLKIYIPMLISFVITRILFQIDLVMVAPLGNDAVAAMAIPGRVLIADLVVSLAMGGVLSSFLSKATSRQDKQNCIKQALGLALMIGLILTILSLFVNAKIVSLIAPHAKIAVLANDALFWLTVCLPFRMIDIVGAMAVYAFGAGSAFIGIELAQLTVNTFLNWLLIYKLNWGFSGAYASTAIVSVLGAAATLTLLMNQMGSQHLFGIPRLQWVKAFLRECFAEMARIASTHVLGFVVMVLVANFSGSSDVLSAFAIMTSLQALLMMPLIAVMRSSAIVAQSNECMKQVSKYGFVISLVAGMTLLLIGPWFGTRLYRLNSGAMSWWLPFFRIVAILLPLRFLNMLRRGRLYNRGAFKQLLMTEACSQWLILLPILTLGLWLGKAWLTWSGYIVAELSLYFFMKYGETT